MTDLAIIGICLNILGVFFVMLAVIVKSPRTIMRELLGMKVDRLRTFKHFIAQRLEAILGFLFVLTGSALQIYVQLAGESAAKNLGLLLVVTILIMGTVGFLVYRLCTYLSKWLFIRFFQTYATKHRLPIHRDESLLVELGDILEIRRDEDETVETFAAKIQARLGFDYRPRR
ncbi:MAG: hypothetical protein ACYTDY_01875 [Planctomycetota bacterium]